MNNQFIQSIRIDWTKVEKDSYLWEIPALQNWERLEFEKNITFFAGENGTGKSTLMEAIAVASGFNPEGGTADYRFRTFDEASDLAEALQVVRGHRRAVRGYFFRAESFFNVATKAEDYRDGTIKEVFYARYGGKSLHEQSHGESFLSYFQSFSEPGLYIMDEPEAALSPQRQLALFIQIAKMAEQGSQFVIATHSPILLAVPGAEIYSFEGEGLTPCNYEETESYRLTELFINEKERMIKELLKEER